MWIFARSMADVVTWMARYSADISDVLANPVLPGSSMSGAWSRTSIQAQEAIQSASAFLRPNLQTSDPLSRHLDAADPVVRRLDAAAAARAAGRDLLHSHVDVRPDGSRLARSEWGQVIIMARALLLGLGLWARRLAEQGARTICVPDQLVGLWAHSLFSRHFGSYRYPGAASS
jgi:hypothetical protein